MDGSVPRAVPADLVVALLGHLAPADLVQKAVLVGIFVLAGAGIARLPATTSGAVAAAIAYVWNPWVLERLVIGHWTFLLGLAVLPWATSAAIRLRAGARGAAASTASWMVVAGLCGSTSLVLVAATAVCVAGWPARGTSAMPGWQRALVVVGPAAAASMVWVLPSLARIGGVPVDPSGVAAFAARPDTPLGTWGSLLTLGGLWNPATWPHERSQLLLALCALVTVAVALVVSLPVLARRVPGLVLAGGAGLVGAAAGSTPGMRSVLRAVVLDVPGGGLLRDGQKLLMPTVLVVCLCVGLTVDQLTAGVRSRRRKQWAAAAAVLVVGVPAAVLPSLAWGAHGRLGSVAYPAEWTAVQRQVQALPGRGDVVSFPFTYYRRFAWNGDRVVLDPVPRLLNRVVVVNDDLPLSTVTVRGEDPRAAAISAALGDGAPLVQVLRAQGVALAVVDMSAPDAARYRAALAGLPVLHDGAELLLVDVGPAAAPPGRTPAWAGIGWVMLVVLVVGVAAWRIMTRPSARLIASGHDTDEMGTPG